MKRFLLSLLCVATLAAQAALPVAHDWLAARQEAGHHQKSSEETAFEESDAHAHHAPAVCRVCHQLNQGRRLLMGEGVSLKTDFNVLSALPLRSNGFVPVSLSAGSAPRGPPPA
ncbi:MAG: DUF2946 family protein [Elusimicrobiota bacterium]